MTEFGEDSSRSERAQSMLLIVLAACSWGTWSLFLRPAGMAPLLSATIVFLTVFVLSLPFLGTGPTRWDAKAWRLLVAFAILDAVNVGSFFAAMNMTSVAIAVLTHSLAPLFVALAAPAIEKVVVPRARIAAVAGVLGIALVLEPFEGELGGNAAWGATLGALSAVAYAGNVFLTRRLVPRIGAVRTMGFHSFGSALLLLPFASGHAHELTLRGALFAIAGGALLGFVANVAFAHGLAKIGAARTAVFTLLEPLVACVVGALFWNEVLTWRSWVGAALVLSSGALVARRSRD